MNDTKPDLHENSFDHVTPVASALSVRWHCQLLDADIGREIIVHTRRRLILFHARHRFIRAHIADDGELPRPQSQQPALYFVQMVSVPQEALGRLRSTRDQDTRDQDWLWRFQPDLRFAST
jgi:hypothetical protein